jgi:hypothetical protein
MIQGMLLVDEDDTGDLLASADIPRLIVESVERNSCISWLNMRH